MMALASSAYYFLSYLTKKDGDSCLLVTFTIVIVLICEVRRGPIYVSNGNMNSNLITGTRTCSLKSAELPFILLFAVIVYYMLYFTHELMSANVFAVVLNITLILLYLLGNDEVEVLRPVWGSENDSRCTDCNLVRPSHAKHCRHCEKCIVQFDHHCVWLDSCIGAGNHLSFLLLLMFVVFHGLYFISTHIFFGNVVVSLNSAAVMHVVLCTTAVFILLLIQLYQIIFLGVTTYERIKSVRYTESKVKERIHKQIMTSCPKFLRVVLLPLPRHLRRFILSEYTMLF